MRKAILVRALSAMAVVGSIALASPVHAQQYYGNGGGPGMMYGCGPGGYGGGMMGPGMMGPGMMMGWGGGYGPDGRAYGSPQQANLNLTVDQVRNNMERWLRSTGNPHIKLGKVVEKDADVITADIVTTDKAVLVERYEVNRHTGYIQALGD